MIRGRLIVAMWPHQHKLNPYTSVLADGLRAHGVDVVEFGWNRRSFRSDILHFHWPNEFFHAPTFGLRWEVWKELFRLAAFRAKGGRLVWTVHNVWPHDRSKQYSLRLRSFLALVNGVIFLNQASMAIACAEHKALIGKRSVVIPPMTYSETFSTPSQQRKCTNNRPVRLGYFGLIRPYKQVDRLMRCMREVPETEAFLTISGMIVLDPREQEYKDLAQNSGNIRFSNEFLADEQLEQFVDDCDAIILPYREILNSGSAIFALSRLRPVMVPDLGSMAELKETVGGNWVFCYSGELTASKIRDFVAWVRTTERTSPPDMSTFDSELVAAMTARFYFSLAS